MMKETCMKERLEHKEISQLRKKTCVRAALTQDTFLPKTLKFRRGVRGIDWVICMCCRRSWNVSRNMCWWMCLWLGSQSVRARLGAGNALTASRLPAWHQNRWMPLIVTVCNVFNSIIPSLSLPHNISLVCSRRQFAESLRGVVLYVSIDSRQSYDYEVMIWRLIINTLYYIQLWE